MQDSITQNSHSHSMHIQWLVDSCFCVFAAQQSRRGDDAVGL